MDTKAAVVRDQVPGDWELANGGGLLLLTRPPASPHDYFLNGYSLRNIYIAPLFSSSAVGQNQWNWLTTLSAEI